LKAGIRVIVSLTEDPLSADSLEFLKSQGIIYYHQPVVDHTPPRLEQLEWFVKLVDEYRAKGLPVLVHCRAGCGRAGTFLTAYLIHSENLNMETALHRMRRLFRGINRLICRSEPNEEQQHLLREFERARQKRTTD
ncbi:MAG: dual specificity protein phosphatase family protein, partial [Promethearchaeota archaeon]